MIGQEARTKSSRFLLAPTLNLHRSPIAGRNFECYAEDPLLAGKTAAGVELGASVADLRQRLEVSTTERRIGP